MPDIILGMKIRFLRDITVDILNQDETFDRLMREGVSLECVEVVPISQQFSNVVLDSESLLVDLRNDSFEQVV
jgi:hypothetical protein